MDPDEPDVSRRRPRRGLAVGVAAIAAGLAVWGGAALVGSAPKKGTPSRPHAAAPSAKPSRGNATLRIVFSKLDSNGRSVGVYTMLADGTGIRPEHMPALPTSQISRTLNLAVYSKTLSSKTGPLYTGCGFAGCTSGYNSSTEAAIAVSNLDGTGERVITGPGGYDSAPSFSPDGKTIAYLQHTKGRSGADPFDEIVLVHPDGRLIRVLAPTRFWTYTSPAWSPDGRSIAAVRSYQYDARVVPQLVIVPIAGSKPRVMARGSFRDLVWSHDGTRILFTAPHYEPQDRNSPPPWHTTGDDLWTLTVKTRHVHRVTFTAPVHETYAIACGADGVSLPTIRDAFWSPDDRRIVFMASYRSLSRLSKVFDLAIVDADGRHMRVLRKAPAARCDRRRWMVLPSAYALLGWSLVD